MFSPSKYNILSKVKDSDNYFIVNLLSGNADIMDESTYTAFQSGNYTNMQELAEKGYLVNPQEEAKVYRTKYLDFLDNRDKDEVQVFFVPWYSCNFACSYCYQEEYSNESSQLTPAIIDAFFDHIKTELASRKKYITVFGGEPLLPGAFYKEILTYFFKKATEENIPLAIVTNGYSIGEYLPLLPSNLIREVQVTLDGTSVTHDNRRFLKGHAPTFHKIVEGIDLLLQSSIPVNLRMVVDKENIENLPELARFAIDKGWTQSCFFKTQLGRNYELHTCQSQRQRLYSRIELYQDLYELIRKHPHILEFHKPAYSVSKFLFEQGELPQPLFDSCPACKTEWAYDYTGKIYSCTATVGKKGEELGTYYPQVSLNKEVVCEWEERDVTSIAECKDCSLQLACGGGCGSVAKNRTGQIQTPDCRPVKELLELGISLYQEE